MRFYDRAGHIGLMLAKCRDQSMLLAARHPTRQTRPRIALAGNTTEAFRKHQQALAGITGNGQTRSSGYSLLVEVQWVSGQSQSLRLAAFGRGETS